MTQHNGGNIVVKILEENTATKKEENEAKQNKNK